LKTFELQPLLIIVAELLAITKKIGCNLDVAKSNSTAAASPSSSASTRTFLWVAIVSTALALPVHSYLMFEHFALRFGANIGKSICDINDLFNCSAVAASEYSEFLNVPMALWGLAANLVLLLLLLWYPLTDDDKKPAARRNLLLVSGAIAAASIVMGTISSVMIGKLCLFCITAYVLSFVTLGAVWIFVKRQSTVPSLKSGFRVSDLTPVLVLAGIAFAGSFIARYQIAKSYGSSQMDNVVKQYVQEWQSSPVQTFTTVDPLVTGPDAKTAKMTLVEFADFRCIHCKHAAPVLKAFMSAHPDVRLEFQPWALDGECNSKIPSSNGASCLLARSSWCAEKKTAKGWAVHDYIFDREEIYPSVEAVKEALPEFAKVAGMSPKDMSDCTSSEEAKAAVRAQADVGGALNLQGTPTIYANGRQLPGGQTLQILNEAYSSLK
jgi:protein-disulfide isomerase/uncharacterized membrane protein